MTAAEIASIIRTHCYVYVQSKEGRTIPTENIQSIEVCGIDTAAELIASSGVSSKEGSKP